MLFCHDDPAGVGADGGGGDDAGVQPGGEDTVDAFLHGGGARERGVAWEGVDVVFFEADVHDVLLGAHNAHVCGRVGVYGGVGGEKGGEEGSHGRV